MIKASISLQDLRRRIYVKAKAEKAWRFWGLYVHVCKMETLCEAYALAKKNKGVVFQNPTRLVSAGKWAISQRLMTEWQVSRVCL